MGREEGVEGKSYWGMGARECDSCKSAAALLYCRADSAFLCRGCDAKIHSANKLASRHERVWMCEVCEQAPAAVTCKADAAALCLACDADIHSANPLARRHERVPVVPFYDSPAARSPESDVGDKNIPPDVKGGGEFLFSEVDRFLDLECDSSMDDGCVVPTKMTASMAHGQPFIPAEGCLDYGAYSAVPSLSRSMSSSDVGVVPDVSSMADISNPYGNSGGVVVQVAAAQVAVGLDREARVMRYREKRKNRKFEKTIRYASRKAYAETRPRIKGRFAKRSEMEADMHHIFASATLGGDPGYGLVPSF